MPIERPAQHTAGGTREQAAGHPSRAEEGESHLELRRQLRHLGRAGGVGLQHGLHPLQRLLLLLQLRLQLGLQLGHGCRGQRNRTTPPAVSGATTSGESREQAAVRLDSQMRCPLLCGPSGLGPCSTGSGRTGPTLPSSHRLPAGSWAATQVAEQCRRCDAGGGTRLHAASLAAARCARRCRVLTAPSPAALLPAESLRSKLHQGSISNEYHERSDWVGAQCDGRKL